MRRTDFHFDLPDELIAQHPVPNRTGSRLLSVDVADGALKDGQFVDVLDWLQPGDLLVCNDTRVVPARLRGKKVSGGAVEIMLERVVDDQNALVQIRASKSPKTGSRIVVDDGAELEVRGREGQFFLLTAPAIHRLFETLGSTPLPPYITRRAETEDRERYQTVYARNPGAVAAPTAGLHFDTELLAAAKSKGIQVEFVTLHVGAGTFQPVRADRIEDHTMHKERYEVSEDLAAAWQSTRSAGNRVVAVGTTTVRCLESALEGAVVAGSGDTDIFIYPGKPVNSIDALITNFHLPESTLIMMVAAIATTELTMQAYRHAVEQRYRFFSYGDAMLIDRGRRA